MVWYEQSFTIYIYLFIYTYYSLRVVIRVSDRWDLDPMCVSEWGKLLYRTVEKSELLLLAKNKNTVDLLYCYEISLGRMIGWHRSSSSSKYWIIMQIQILCFIIRKNSVYCNFMSQFDWLIDLLVYDTLSQEIGFNIRILRNIAKE